MNNYLKFISSILLIFLTLLFTFGFVSAQTPVASPASTAGAISPSQVDITSSGFKLLICDGPPLPKTGVPIPPNYVPCDFKGLMMQAQHLINIALVLGVVIAILSFTWAGALYVSGNPSKISDAHKIFPKIFWGFIIMLSAWFIVYQILNWLTGTGSFGVLLGNP